jgi:hypothetical protein
MKIFKVGDRGRGMCDKCNAFVDTTYSLKDVPFSDGSGIVKNILVGICNHCDSIVSMPYQSTPVIKTQLDKQRISFESRIPAHMIDILNLASFELGGNTDFVSSIMKYYIHALSIEELSAKDMAKYLESNLAKGKAQKRFSIKGKNIADDIYKLKKITNIDSTSDLIKIVILRIYDDILMKKNPEPIKFLKSLVAISC